MGAVGPALQSPLTPHQRVQIERLRLFRITLAIALCQSEDEDVELSECRYSW